MSDPETMRRKAAGDYFSNPQTPMASEQSIYSSDARNNYNAELARQRQADDDRRRNGG